MIRKYSCDIYLLLVYIMNVVHLLCTLFMREISDLHPEEKVQAVLAAIPYPMTRNIAIHSASIDLSQISEDSRDRIESLFSSLQTSDLVAERCPRTSVSSNEMRPGEQVYCVLDSERLTMLNRLNVDAKSVKIHVANVGREYLKRQQ